MHLVKTRSLVTSGFLGLVFLLAPADALSWSQRARIMARVHHHEFDVVRVESNGCTLNLELYFTAPEAGYREPAPVRNHYRFDARVQFADGRKFFTGVFQNTQPGRRVLRHAYDTNSEGCWAKQELKLRGVDVEGCRNRRCKVPAFK
jgi:hypothetical protein